MANQEYAEITKTVVALIAEALGVDTNDVGLTANFVEDLGADSLDLVELVMAFETEFSIEIPDSKAEEIVTVTDAIEHIHQAKKSKA